MNKVRPKKYLGQHFLNDENIAEKIVSSLIRKVDYNSVLEIGPGMGVLTKYLLRNNLFQTSVVEIDVESRNYLKIHFPELDNRISSEDFLKMDLGTIFKQKTAIIGNFPYNISTQILFKTLENKELVPELVGMMQREVVQRICASHGSKTYGILSVLLQAFYDLEYLFEVPPEVFIPAPKVYSAVFRMTRNERKKLDCSEKMFFRVVKLAFQTRRKTLRNSLKTLALPEEIRAKEIFNLRAEQLSVEDFIKLTSLIQENAV